MAKNDIPKNVRCSFCGKSQENVRKIVAGPGVYICDECVDLCTSIIQAEEYEDEEVGYTLNELDKIPSPNNNNNNGEIRYKWRTETVRRMLSNRVYLGHTQYGKRINLSYKSKKVKYIPQEEWKIAYNTHEAIIDLSLIHI